MPRPRKSADRWSHPLYRTGFVLNRGGVAYTEINGVRLSTGLMFVPENKRVALEILERRVLEHLNPQEHKQGMMLSEAAKEFAAVELSGMTSHTRKHYRQMFEKFLPLDCDLNDSDVLQTVLKQQIADFGGGDSSLRTYMDKLHRFFAYCVKRRWMQENPMLFIAKPKKNKASKRTFERYEVEAIIAESRKRNRVEFALFVAFIGETAMRINEATRLRWRDVDASRILVDGKGGRERQFPLKPFPKVAAVLEELRLLTGGGEKLFTFTDSMLQHYIRQTCERLGMEARSFHAIRRMVENEWIFERGMTVHVAAELAGHSVAVQERAYKRQATYNDLERLLS